KEWSHLRLSLTQRAAGVPGKIGRGSHSLCQEGFFMTMRFICSWQHQATSRGRWASKRLLMELVSHLGKKLLLPGLLNWTQRTRRERTAELS
ncbi:hypothetical protein LEMLEM_LOCUS5324, partial [Lemmus lemmus]